VRETLLSYLLSCRARLHPERGSKRKLHYSHVPKFLFFGTHAPDVLYMAGGTLTLIDAFNINNGAERVYGGFTTATGSVQVGGKWTGDY